VKAAKADLPQRTQSFAKSNLNQGKDAVFVNAADFNAEDAKGAEEIQILSGRH